MTLPANLLLPLSLTTTSMMIIIIIIINQENKNIKKQNKTITRKITV